MLQPGLAAKLGQPVVVEEPDRRRRQIGFHPAVAARIRGVGSEPGQATRADVARVVRTDHDRRGAVVKRAGIRAA